MSKEEKEAQIIKNKTAITAAVRIFVNSNSDIRRLLVINSIGQPIDSASEEDLRYADSLSYDELVDEGYIFHEIKPGILDNNKEKVHCRLFVDASDTSIDFTVFCDYEYWYLDNFFARPVEIQKIIYKYFEGKEGILSRKLSYLSCSNQVLRYDVGVVMAIYNERYSMYSIDNTDDKDEKEFPLNHYEDILHVVIDRLVNNTDVKKYIGHSDADEMSAEELIDNRYIRLAQRAAIDNENDPDHYIIIDLEDSLGLKLSFDILSKNSESISSNGKDENKAILKCIKDAMNMIPGVEAKGSHSNYTLNSEWTLYRALYSVNYSKETLSSVIDEKYWKRVKPRFFVDVDTLNRILDFELSNEEFESNEIQELHIDITDIPYYMWLTRTDNGKELTIYDRNEFHVSYDLEGIEKGKITLSKENGAKGTASDGAIGENLGAFFKASMLVSKHFLESSYANDIDYIDFDKEGFEVFLSEEGIHFKIVSGTARPSMMCSSLFNPTRMMRPYMDEIAGSIAKEVEGGES